jgi:hypothetical protein
MKEEPPGHRRGMKIQGRKESQEDKCGKRGK